MVGRVSCMYLLLHDAETMPVRPYSCSLARNSRQAAVCSRLRMNKLECSHTTDRLLGCQGEIVCISARCWA